jgi:AcrR family transcriptional regulator
MGEKHQSQEPSSESTKDDSSARERLMDAAIRLFAEHGLEGTSTRDIAKATDLNISLISYYFGGKEGLYKTVIDEYAARLRVESDKLLSSVDLESLDRDTFCQTMHTLIHRMIPMKYESRTMSALLQREMMSGLPFAKDVFENVFGQILEKIVSIYRAGQKKGFIRKEIHPYILFFSMIHTTETYLQMNQCQTQVQNKILKLPQEMPAYAEQIYLIFVEGALA